MKLRFLGKDPQSGVKNCPTMFATDRADRKTYILRGWEVTDSQALADAGENPPGELLIEVPADIFRFIEEDDRQADAPEDRVTQFLRCSSLAACRPAAGEHHRMVPVV